MRAHVPWPQPLYDAPVQIEVGKSDEEILDRDYLNLLLKSSNIDRLGIMLDADTNLPSSRYHRIRNECLTYFPNLPNKISAQGVVAENNEGKWLGVWVMPDNVSDGGLEAFLRRMVPVEAEPLWKHAGEALESAKGIGAACRECHYAKAQLYTWLAWQDPPGQHPGIALTKKVLDPMADSASVFVDWFKMLYGMV
jgi:hypothetical protein